LPVFWKIKQRKPNQLPIENYEEAWAAITEADRRELREAGAVEDEATDKSFSTERNTHMDIVGIIARKINDGEPSGLSEHQFVELVKAQAASGARDGETVEQSFVRLYEGNPEIRRATKILKGYPVPHQQSVARRSSGALGKLNAVADELLKRV
jgi:hypothetical protein